MSDTHSDAVAEAFLVEVRNEFRALKKQADAALSQVTPDALFAQLDGEANSLAMVVKHMGGNLRSRWTDFLTSDGEKPDRHRDNEFVIRDSDTPEALRESWELGWECVIGTVDALTPGDLSKDVSIRRERLPVMRAIVRALTHAAGHVGQIVLLAKHAQGTDWRTLSIARGASEQANRDAAQAAGRATEPSR
jgi:hypothetical protein